MSNKIDVQLPVIGDGKTLCFTYTNWRGVTEDRTVLPLKLQFGVTPEHPEPCWMLFSMCVDRKAHRSFMLSKMSNVSSK